LLPLYASSTLARCLGASCLVTLLAGGCARYHPRPISAQTEAAALEARSLDDAGLAEFVRTNLGEKAPPWPAEQWGLSLLTLAAFYYHPDLDVARARWGVAQAVVVTAGGQPNPDLDLSAERVTHTEASSLWILGFNLQIPIETMHKRGYRIARAKHLSDVARLDIGATAWTVRARLRSSLLELWAATSRLALVRKQEALQAERVAMLERRLAVGAASTPEVTFEQIALEAIRVAARADGRQAGMARARLASAVGVPAEALDRRGISYEAVAGAAPAGDPAQDELRRTALLGRPDVLSLLAEYEAAQSALQLQIARQYPDLRLGPGYTWEQGENHFALGLSLVLPILNRNRGPIGEAEARRKEVAARFVALQARVVAQLDEALASYRAATEALRAAGSRLEAQAKNERAAEAAFHAGEADRLELRSSELQLAAVELSRFDALVERQRATGEIEDAAQRPFFDATVAMPAAEHSLRPEGEKR
jgi:cobalt-zinc-cadmium efflux system outer membrane protein